jgi:hypothetical protein
MSLHKFADMVAKQGRGDDSLLIHMTPDEVRNLQKFAEANGKTLTINPTTGLPEAGMLSDLFKTIAPIALGAFLGPAGVALGGPGLTAGMAGLATGGITALATGSLSRGLMAGLGAYGGAGIGESLMNAGTGALSQSVGAGLSEEAAQQAVASKLASATPMETLTAGFNSATASPAAMGTFAKNNLTNIGMAAAPIMAGAMVPTTTKMPENTNPAYIRQKLYDPYTQTYKSLTPVKASEFGGRNFSDAYTNPQTGQMDTLQPRAPSGFAGGGIVALANGGLSAGAQYAATHGVDVGANIGKWIQDNPFATAADISTAIKTAGLTQEDVNPYLTANTNISDATRYALSHATEMPGAGGLAGMQANILKGFATPNLTQTQIDTEQRKYGVSNADIQSPLAHGYQIPTTDIAKAENYLKSNTDVQAWLNSAEGRDYLKQHPTFDASDIAYTHFKRYGEGEGRTWEEAAKKPIVCGPGMELNAAGTACVPIKKIDDKKIDKTCGTGYTWSEATQSCVKDIIEWKACETGYHWDKAAQACVKNVDATQNTTTTVTTPTSLTTVPATALSVGVGGTTGPSIYGGGSTVNPNGTITTSPVIPGIPVGGFTGMESLRDAYTAGGGSLGYIPKAPKTMAEFEQLYNKQTGDSLAAYDYLMGKGGGKYPVQSKAASTAEGIMRPYFSAGVKYKPRFLSAGKDGTVTESSTNPNAPKAGGAKAAELTKAKTIDIVDSSGYNTETYTAVLQEDGTYLAGNGKRYDVNGKQIAAGGGMMGYAMGGGLGSLGSYSDGGRLLKGPGDGVSDSIPATIGRKQQPARLADGEFVIPARIVSELGNGSTDAGAKKLYAMMDRVQRARGKTTGKNKVAANSRADKYLPA